MNRHAHPFAAVIVSLATLGIVGLAIGAEKKKPDKPDATVTMKRTQFVPEAVTIKKGQTVRWENKDDRDYLIKADDDSFKSDNLRPKDTFDHTFKEAGTFGYKNVIRMRESGTITVED